MGNAKVVQASWLPVRFKDMEEGQYGVMHHSQTPVMATKFGIICLTDGSGWSWENLTLNPELNYEVDLLKSDQCIQLQNDT